MRVYFVRHGSTDLLEKGISQTDNEPLNERGRKQAKELAQRFKNSVIDLVFSSPHTRARQTAEMISTKIEISNLWAEVRKPQEIIGRPREDEKVKVILKKIGEMYLTDPKWHYADEENFEDLKKRGLAALEFLISKKKENIVVVSHANLIALMIGLMLFGKDYTVETSLKMKNFLRLSNTGVSICTYNEGKWKLQCWNDTSHCLE